MFFHILFVLKISKQEIKDAAKEEPTTRLIQTKSGHILQFDDEEERNGSAYFIPRTPR